jgi:hypothetical protein
LKKNVWSQMLLPMPPIREPNTKRSLFADLEPSQSGDRPVDRPALLILNIAYLEYFQKHRLYRGVAMAGQEIEGDLWDQSLGLDLLPLSARVKYQN